MKKFNRFFTVLMFIFLYAPMAVLIVASFNTGKDITQFEGFTFRQYIRLFQDNTLLALLGNSILVAILSSLIATAFGTVAALGINALSPKMRKLAMTLTDIPMTNPDIVTGVSLSLLFIFVGSNLLGQKESLTFWTLLIAHITFSLPYVILNVMPKLKQMDSSLTDAAMDLGCTPLQSFFKVTLPEIMPGILAGGIMAMIMCFNNFVMQYYLIPIGVQTLPTLVFTRIRSGYQADLNALSAIIVLVSVAVVIVLSKLGFSAGGLFGMSSGSNLKKGE